MKNPVFTSLILTILLSLINFLIQSSKGGVGKKTLKTMVYFFVIILSSIYLYRFIFKETNPVSKDIDNIMRDINPRNHIDKINGNELFKPKAVEYSQNRTFNPIQNRNINRNMNNNMFGNNIKRENAMPIKREGFQNRFAPNIHNKNHIDRINDKI